MSQKRIGLYWRSQRLFRPIQYIFWNPKQKDTFGPTRHTFKLQIPLNYVFWKDLRLTFEGSTYKNVIKRKYHTVGTVPNCKRKMVERDKIDPSNTQIHVYSFAWLGAGISIKNDGVKLVFLENWCGHASIFRMWVKCQRLHKTGRMMLL